MPLEVESHLSASPPPILTDLRVLRDGFHRRSEKTNEHFRVGLPNLFPRVLVRRMVTLWVLPGQVERLEVGEICPSGTPIFSAAVDPSSTEP